jgi:hypothetical protein
MAYPCSRSENDDRLAVTATPAGSAPTSIIPLPPARWWCTRCGRLESDESASSDCLYTLVAGHARVAAGGPAGAPLVEGIDRGLERIEAAQYLVVEAQLRTEHLLDDHDRCIHRTLSGTAEILHDLGTALLAAHSALTHARLVAPEAS